MLLACLALGLISCRDTIDPREASPLSQVQQQVATGPVTVLRLTCTFSFSNGEQGEVHCGEASARTKGMNRPAFDGGPDSCGAGASVLPVSNVLCGLLSSSHRDWPAHYTGCENALPTRVRWRPPHTQSW